MPESGGVMGIRGQYKNKRDANEKDIVSVLEAHGMSVERLDTPADLLVGFRGRTYLVEVKTLTGKMSDPQKEFYRDWRGNKTVLTDVDQARAWASSVRSGGDDWQAIGAIAARMVRGDVS